jgi:hypothetical protein
MTGYVLAITLQERGNEHLIASMQETGILCKAER